MSKKSKSRTTAQLFNIGNLYEHLLDLGYYIHLDKNRSISTSWTIYESARFSLFYSPDIKEKLEEVKALPRGIDITPYLDTQVVPDYSELDYIMDYVISNKILTDSKIIKAWNNHQKWYEYMDDQLFGILCNDYYVQGSPDDETRSIFEYEDTVIIRNLALLFLSVTEVNFQPYSFDSQQKILDEVTSFMVNELIPTINRFEISNEQFQKLLEPAYKYTSQLFWIYGL